MKKLFITMMVAMIAIAANAQYSTNYYNQYGNSIGSSTTHSNYGGGTTTTYYDVYGNNIGSSSDW